MEKWEKIKAVQRMQDYISEKLNEVITLNQLARASGYSQWHAERIFKELTGMLPFEYIRTMRLSKAAENLEKGGSRVIDVAFDFVFDSHEGFTRAFSRQFGVSPREVSRGRKKLKLFLPERVKDYYLKLQRGEIIMPDKKNASTVFVQVVDRPERKVIIKRGVKATHYFEYCEEVGCDIWDRLTEIKGALYEPSGMWLPKNLVKYGTSSYVQGVEVPMDYDGVIPEGFEIIQLAPCKMMIFQGEAFKDEDFGEAIEELWDVIRRYDPKIYGFEWADEDAPRFQLEPLGYRGYIEGKPVRELKK
ncbi:MAG: AraC family transcriptional regulator [Eubacteriaceae bacterium]|nr:AraC family transcriptional regulator [Eubacteriaceae bacterium]